MFRILFSFTALSLGLNVYAHEAKLDDIQVIEAEETQGLGGFVPNVTKIKRAELLKKTPNQHRRYPGD